MQVFGADQPHRQWGERAGTHIGDDPLGTDDHADPIVLMTPRGTARIALVAAETGARFQREGCCGDPLAWLTTPQRLFGGATALEVCMERGPCLRALLMHGLNMPLDRPPEELDALLERMWVEDGGEPDGAGTRLIGSADDRRGGRRLYTSLLVHEDEDEVIQAFGATVASSRAEAHARLAGRHERRLALLVEISEGFDASAPLVEALVSPALSDMLMQIVADPASPLATGLEVAIEQRFAA